MPRYVHGDPFGRNHNRLRGPARLASFWSALLDITVTGEHSDAGWATVGSRLDHQPRLTFQRVPEPKTAKVRIHLDIQVDDIGAARRQVEDLGGRWSGEQHDYDDGIVIVMHDPENHEFCLVQYYDLNIGASHPCLPPPVIPNRPSTRPG
jgi:predicted enzyme related to lactoylglutathione lyase